jgi:hypothetical protein
MSSATSDASCLPDKTAFEFWHDSTEYGCVYHVDQRHRDADDGNPGTIDRPFATIGRAAELLKPGEKVIVHAGIYRECVRPARGGQGPQSMIAYEAAPGEKVVICGSRLWRPNARPSSGWKVGALDSGATIWMAELPAEWFVGYNPFSVRNIPAEFASYGSGWSKQQLRNALKYRGMIFQDGRPLRQVFRCGQLAEQAGAFWVEEPGLLVHFRLPDDASPGGAELEVTVNEQVFCPLERGLGYLRVSGFVMEHAADGVPVPQRALLSTARGHHWIIEDNAIRHANACGMDLGAQDWKAAADAGAPAGACGCHVVRRNTISDCGICGIAGAGKVDGTLIEDNTLQRIGGLDMESLWESAAMKLHFACGCLIRRNVFRHIRHGAGLWLDCMNHNNRITANVFADIEGQLGAIFLEGTRRVNRVDGNVVWSVRSPAEAAYPPGGIVADCGDNITVDHNLVACVEPPEGANLESQHGYAVAFNLVQSKRVVEGRVGLCRGNTIRSNIIARSRRRVLLGRREGNDCDGNLYDSRHDSASLCVAFPQPPMAVDLAAWQGILGLDISGGQAELDAVFDPDSLELTIRLAGPAPRMAEPVGPLSEAQWRRLLANGQVTFRVPAGAEQ